jgi:hypothetical protein
MAQEKPRNADLPIAGSIYTMEFGSGHCGTSTGKILRRKFGKLREIHIRKANGRESKHHVQSLEHIRSPVAL